MGEWKLVESVLPPLRDAGNAKPYVIAADSQGRMAIGWFSRLSDATLAFTSAKPIGPVTHWMPLPDPPEVKD